MKKKKIVKMKTQIFFKLSLSRFLPPRFDSRKRSANKVVTQINYSTYLNITISDINLLNVFRLFVSSAISYAIPEKFTMNRVSRRCFPRYSNGGGRCIVG